MSPLTKAFVVLVTLLSILLVTLVVPFAAQVDGLREELDTAEAIASASRVTIADLNAQRQALSEQIQARETTQNNTLTNLESRVSQLQGENDNLRAELAKAQANNQQIRATIIASQESIKTNTALLQTTMERLRTTNEKLVDRSTENTQLIARNNQLEADRTALENANRMLREQSIALGEEVALLEGALIAEGGQLPRSSGDTAAAVPVPTEPVYGKVIGQAPIPGGRVLVSLNIGSSDGVVKNQRFVAYRGDNELVANLEIQTVDASESVAVVLSEEKSIRDGDAVVSAQNL